MSAPAPKECPDDCDHLPRDPTGSARSTRCARSAALIRNPDDTALVFEIIEALSGRSRTRVFDRFRRTESGQRLLAERPNLLARLTDRESLLALPAGTLGRTYGEFMSREQISRRRPRRRERELAARRPARRPALVRGSPARHARPLARRDRLRPRPDRRGVAARVHLRADPQPRDRLHRRGRLPQGARDRSPRRGACCARATGAAARAAWLPGVEWEALLEQPLARVREQLGVGAAARLSAGPLRRRARARLAAGDVGRSTTPRGATPIRARAGPRRRATGSRARSSSVSRESSSASRAASRPSSE